MLNEHPIQTISAKSMRDIQQTANIVLNTYTYAHQVQTILLSQLEPKIRHRNYTYD